MSTKTNSIKSKISLFLAAVAATVFAVAPVVSCTTADPTLPERDYYIVSFNSNGGSEVNPQIVYSGKKVTRPADPIKSGKVFVNWYSDRLLTTVWNFSAGTVSSDMTLHAAWRTYGNIEIDDPEPEQPGGGGSDNETTYTVTFHGNGGAWGSDTQKQLTTDAQGVLASLPAQPVHPAGKTFKGYTVGTADTGAYINLTKTYTENTDVYAQWGETQGGGGGGDTETTYTVTFHGNGGAWGSDTQKQLTTDAQGVLASLPAQPVHPAGKTFKGYTVGTADTGTYINLTKTYTENTDVYAQWGETQGGGGGGGNSGGNFGDDYEDGLPATVTFNVGRAARLEGACNPSPKSALTGQTITAPTAARAGYTLSGWYLENSDTLWNFATDKVGGNMTLFAKWSNGGGSSEDREDYTPSMTEPNTFYIHYRRSDGDYSGWHIWGWTSKSTSSWYESAGNDDSGAVFAIDLSSFGEVSSVNFLVAKNSWELKDGESDNTVALANTQKIGESYHWYVDSGTVAMGKNYLAKENSGGTGGPTQTEPLRASRNNVDRSVAQGISVEDTVSGWDETGVGYQIFVASFCDSNDDGLGDIRGIINKLDYLDSLNVDVLWLTPIQSSNSSHGYDCYDYYSIDPKFGTNADYRELVYKAHKKGIKIIMDLVVNHTSPNNEWFIKSQNGVVETVTYQDGSSAEVHYRDFYRWQSSGGNRYYQANGWYFYSSFGANMPELNYDCQQVRDAMADVASYWMSYGLDGFRMDAIKHLFMWDESENRSGDTEGGANDPPYNYNLTKNVEFFKEFNHKLKSVYPNCYLLGEQLSGNVNDVSPFYMGMDSLFDFNIFYDLPTRIASGNASAQANALNSNAQKYNAYRSDRAINSMISSNHDIPRLADKIPDEAKRRLYIAVTMTLPGLSWIYYGDEIGLIGGGTDTDQRYRQPMKWTSDWDNACTNIPNIRNYGVNNHLASVAEQSGAGVDSQLRYVMGLTAVRDEYPALISGSATCSSVDGMLKIEVRSGSQTVVSYHNFSASSKTVSESGRCVFGSNSLGGYGTAIFVK